MADRKRVLITGISGQIGGVVREALMADHDVSGLDLRPADGFQTTVADMTDLEAILPAFEGIDTVVDLANNPAGNLSWHHAYRNNIPAVYNSLEAARRCGVKRVIFASSNRASENYELDQPYANICAGDYTGLTPGEFPLVTTDMPVRPQRPLRHRQMPRRGCRPILLRPPRPLLRRPPIRHRPTRQPPRQRAPLRHRPKPPRPRPPGRALRHGPRHPPLRHLLRSLQQHLEILGHHQRPTPK